MGRQKYCLPIVIHNRHEKLHEQNLKIILEQLRQYWKLKGIRQRKKRKLYYHPETFNPYILCDEGYQLSNHYGVKHKVYILRKITGSIIDGITLEIKIDKDALVVSESFFEKLLTL